MKKHYRESVIIDAQAEDIFTYIDDHTKFSSHMNNSSWMMGGGHMDTSVDKGHGQIIGSHIKMSGRVFGVNIFLDEVVTRHEPPILKAWETVGDLNLLVIGHYQMEIKIQPKNSKSLLNISIDYDLPQKNAWLGRLFGDVYARWCVKQMINGVKDHFTLKTKITQVRRDL